MLKPRSTSQQDLFVEGIRRQPRWLSIVATCSTCFRRKRGSVSCSATEISNISSCSRPAPTGLPSARGKLQRPLHWLAAAAPPLLTKHDKISCGVFALSSARLCYPTMSTLSASIGSHLLRSVGAGNPSSQLVTAAVQAQVMI